MLTTTIAIAFLIGIVAGIFLGAVMLGIAEGKKMRHEYLNVRAGKLEVHVPAATIYDWLEERDMIVQPKGLDVKTKKETNS